MLGLVIASVSLGQMGRMIHVDAEDDLDVDLATMASSTFRLTSSDVSFDGIPDMLIFSIKPSQPREIIEGGFIPPWRYPVKFWSRSRRRTSEAVKELSDDGRTAPSVKLY